MNSKSFSLWWRTQSLRRNIPSYTKWGRDKNLNHRMRFFKTKIDVHSLPNLLFFRKRTKKKNPKKRTRKKHSLTCLASVIPFQKKRWHSVSFTAFIVFNWTEFYFSLHQFIRRHFDLYKPVKTVAINANCQLFIAIYWILSNIIIITYF